MCIKATLKRLIERSGRREMREREGEFIYYFIVETGTRYEKTRREIKGGGQRELNLKEEDGDGLEGDGDHGAPGRGLRKCERRGARTRRQESRDSRYLFTPEEGGISALK